MLMKVTWLSKDIKPGLALRVCAGEDNEVPAMVGYTRQDDASAFVLVYLDNGFVVPFKSGKDLADYLNEVLTVPAEFNFPERAG